MAGELKRKYEAKLNQRLADNQEFLIQKLRSEWDQIQKSAKRERLIEQAKSGAKTIGKILLSLLAVGGIVTIAAVAPNVLGAYSKIKGRKRFFEKSNFNKSKNYLIKQKYIRLVQKSNDLFEIKLTRRGLGSVLQESFKNLDVQQSGAWDKFWRIVIFDIPEKHKWAREGFRKKLQEMGFLQLQKSAFIIPYPCEKEVNFLATIFSITPYVLFIETERLSNAAMIKKHFDLL